MMFLSLLLTLPLLAQQRLLPADPRTDAEIERAKKAAFRGRVETLWW